MLRHGDGGGAGPDAAMGTAECESTPIAASRAISPRVAGRPRGARRGALLKFSGRFRADQQTACAGNLSPIFANGGSRRRPVGRPCPATLWKSAGAVGEGKWRGRPVSRLDRTYGKKLRRPAAVIFSLRPDPTPMRRTQLCAVLGAEARPALAAPACPLHSYSCRRNSSSSSGGRYRRILVFGSSSRASASSFIARLAST
jgi:hypothetical protein